MSDEFIEKKSKVKVIITIVIILVILGGCGYFGYSLVKREILNPNKYLVNTKDYLVKSINSKFDNIEIDNKNIKDSKETGNISFKTNNKDMDYFNKFSINYNVLSSIEKEEIQTKVSFNESGNSILDGNIYLQKESIYLDSKDLYNKVLLLGKLDTNIFNSFKENNSNGISIKDIKSIISNYISYILLSLAESDTKSEFVEIFKVKYTYEITNSNVSKVQNKFNELIDKDENLKLLLKENNINLDIEFKPIKIEITKSIGTGEIYNLYISGEDIDFNLERDEKNRDLYHIKDGEDTGTLEINKDTWTLQEFKNEELKLTIKMVNNNDLFKISITDNNTDISIGLKEVNKDTLNVTFVVKVKGEEEVSIDLSGTIQKEENGLNTSIIIDILINEEKIRMNINDKIEYGDNLLESVDVSNYSEYDKLSEKEVNTIYENLYKKLDGSMLLDLMSQDNRV